MSDESSEKPTDTIGVRILPFRSYFRTAAADTAIGLESMVPELLAALERALGALEDYECIVRGYSVHCPTVRMNITEPDGTVHSLDAYNRAMRQGVARARLFVTFAERGLELITTKPADAQTRLQRYQREYDQDVKAIDERQE